MRKTFIFYSDREDYTEEMTDAEKWQFLQLILDYQKWKEVSPEWWLKFIRSRIKKQLDDDNEKYDEVCERNRKNIEKRRWKTTKTKTGKGKNTKNTTGTTGIPPYTTGYHSIPDNDNDNDNDNIYIEDNIEDDNDNKNKNTITNVIVWPSVDKKNNLLEKFGSKKIASSNTKEKIPITNCIEWLKKWLAKNNLVYKSETRKRDDWKKLTDRHAFATLLRTKSFQEVCWAYWKTEWEMVYLIACEWWKIPFFAGIIYSWRWFLKQWQSIYNQTLAKEASKPKSATRVL